MSQTSFSPAAASAGDAVEDPPAERNLVLVLGVAAAGAVVLALAVWFLVLSGGGTPEAASATGETPPRAAPAATEPTVPVAPEPTVAAAVAKPVKDPFKPLVFDAPKKNADAGTTAVQTESTAPPAAAQRTIALPPVAVQPRIPLPPVAAQRRIAPRPVAAEPTTAPTAAAEPTTAPPVAAQPTTAPTVAPASGSSATPPVPSVRHAVAVLAVGPDNTTVTVEVDGKTYTDLIAGQVFATYFKVRLIGGSSNSFQFGDEVFTIAGTKGITIG